MTETCQRCGNRPGDRTLTLEAPRLEAGGKTPNPARLLLPVCGACFEQLARKANGGRPPARSRSIREPTMKTARAASYVSSSMAERPPRRGPFRLPRSSGASARPRGARAPARLRPRPPARVQRF